MSTTAFGRMRSPAALWAYLDDIMFPCSRNEIVRCAEDNEAPDAILDAIESMPDRSYWSVRDIITQCQKRA